jgi:hypothetical protein
VSDAQLLTMLEKVNEQMPKTGITVRAPRCAAARIAASDGNCVFADQPPPAGHV